MSSVPKCQVLHIVRSCLWYFYLNKVIFAVLHAAARVVMDLRPRDHVSSALRELYYCTGCRSSRGSSSICACSSTIHSYWSFTSIHKWPADVCCRRTWTTRPPNGEPWRFHRATDKSEVRRAFCVAAPRVWNRLPADLRQLRSTQTFRRHL